MKTIKNIICIGKLVQMHVLVILFHLLLGTDLVVEFRGLKKTLYIRDPQPLSCGLEPSPVRNRSGAS